MKTLPKLTTALLLGASLAVPLSLVSPTPAVAADKEKPKAQVSAKAAKPLKAAQDALQAKKYQDAISKLKEVEGMSGKSPYDEHVMNELFGYAYVRLMDYQQAAKYLEPALNDGFLDQGDMEKRVKELVTLNYQLKNYDKVIELGQRAFKGGYADENSNTATSQAYYIKGDYKGALKFTDALVDSEIKKGEMPKEQQLNLVLSSCVKLDDAGCETHALERMVQYYPKPEYWQQLVFSMFQNKDASNSDTDMLNIYRLASDVDVLNKPQEYTEMAQLAITQGSPGEAVRVLEKGFQKNVFTEQREKERNQRLLDSAKKQATTDQASLAKLEKEADAAPTGQKDVGVGLGYFSYQQYDKAADFLSKGLMKGGVKDETQARMVLGIAQLKSGKRDEAVKTFQSIKNGDPTMQRLASLWTLHARESDRVASR